MFFLKKLVSSFLLPLPAVLVLVATGVGLLWFTKRQRAGKVLVTIALGLLVLSSYGAVPSAFVGALEDDHKALYPRESLESSTIAAGRTPKWVVVLGSGHGGDDKIPPSGRMDCAALSRLVEGIRIHRELPGTKLLLSGGVGRAPKHGQVLGAAAEALGVSPENIVIDTSAWDTEQEAHNLTPRIARDDFVLVTSAFHMPRAVMLFRGRGADPIPAPTNHLALEASGVGLHDFFPQAGNIVRMHVATHEYLGMVWSKVRQ